MYYVLPNFLANYQHRLLLYRLCSRLQGVSLAKLFEELVLEDQRFEIPAPRHLGMVVFRLKVRSNCIDCTVAVSANEFSKQISANI